MKVFVTGVRGFIGKNLVCNLANRGHTDIFELDTENTAADLDKFCAECDFVFHLAGINRPRDEKEFMEGNFDFTSQLLESLKKATNKSPVLLTSSIQAALDNPYGNPKKQGKI